MERHQILKTEQKALEINLNEKIYGTFAEIGAGQEVARNFFQAGAAVGTIAKTMSAYDKTYSDAIYGTEDSKRYVCESRLYKMLDHEYGLMEERLQDERPDTCFFVFADTVAAINYRKTIKGDGWLGVRFQLSPNEKPNECMIHVKMLDNDNRLQQEAIGIIGVNLIYACYFYHNDYEQFVYSLIDGLRGRVNVDMVRLTGPRFQKVDNRLLGLYLVKHDLTPVTMFDENKNSVHASEFLYKKALMVVRGHYRPPTLVTVDVIEKSFEQFKQEPDVNEEKAFMVAEMTLDNLELGGAINEYDFILRADLLCAMGMKIIISNCNNHQGLINYLSTFKIQKLGLVIGINELGQIVEEKYEQNQDGRLLVAFGELFTRNIKIYAYPALDEETKALKTASNLVVPEGIKFLYKYLIDSQHIVEVKKYDKALLEIFPHQIYRAICEGQTGWEDKLPKHLADMIQEKGMFCYLDDGIQAK